MAFTKPSKRYEIELQQVADASDDLLEFFADSPNMLPNGFPSEAVMTLCSALKQLPMGSVEGSVPVLEAGREQCPTIRRNYIPPEPKDDDPDHDPDAPPVFRGGNLDKLINNLYVTIGTAIDAYKEEHGVGFQESIELDPPVKAQPEFVLKAAIDNARAAELELARFQLENSDELAQKEELRRGLVDVDNDLKVGRSTALMPQPKPNLLSRIGYIISKAPEALQAIGRAAQIGVDVADPVLRAAAEILISSWESMLQAISTAGAGIEESGRRLAAWRSANWNKDDESQVLENEVTHENIDWLPFDKNRAKSMIVDGDDLPAHWIPEVDTLNFNGVSNTSWRDVRRSREIISKCKNLKILKMGNQFFTDIYFVSSLTNLREISIAGSGIVDLTGIELLHKLRKLNLNGLNNLKNIDAIGNLQNLAYLAIRNTAVSDLSPIMKLDDIEFLIIDNNPAFNEYLPAIKEKFPNLQIIANSKARRRRRGRGGKSKRISKLPE